MNRGLWNVDPACAVVELKHFDTNWLLSENMVMGMCNQFSFKGTEGGQGRFLRGSYS